MNKKLFVGGLNFKTNEAVLRSIFEEIGPVEDLKIIVDHETGRSKGFGFVTFAQAEDAEATIKKFDGQELDGRTVKVSPAIENNRKNGGPGSNRGSRQQYDQDV